MTMQPQSQKKQNVCDVDFSVFSQKCAVGEDECWDSFLTASLHFNA